MNVFNYKAKDKNGKQLKGMIEALDEKQAASLLHEQGLLIITLTKKKESLLDSLEATFSVVSDNDVVEFTRQISTMVNAGLPLTDALIILRDQTKNLQMAKIIDGLLNEVQGGSSLAAALSKHPSVFSPVYIALIKAGEAAGVLDKVTIRLADNLEKNREFSGKVKGALLYPAIVSVTMILVVAVMMIFVFPKLTAMYKDFNAKLPLPTMILMKISDLTVRFAPIVFGAIFALIVLAIRFIKTKNGRLVTDKLLFKIPLIGVLQKQIALTEFTRTFALLVSTGIPIIEALNIVADAVGNAVYQKAIKEAAIEVEQGLALAVPITQNSDFPPIVGQMIKVGEESGKMDEVLGKLSNYFESEADHLVKGLTTAIEPIIMVVLGIGVTFLIISVLMPIYNLTNQF